MANLENAPEVEKSGLLSTRAKLAIVTLGTGAIMIVPAAMATEFNLTAIGEIIDGFVTILPKFLDLVIGAAPVIIGISIVGAVVAFPEKILGMFKI